MPRKLFLNKNIQLRLKADKMILLTLILVLRLSLVLRLNLRRIINLLLKRGLLEIKMHLLIQSGLLVLLKRKLKRQLWLQRILLGMYLLRMLLGIYLLKMLLKMHLLLQMLLVMYLLLRNAKLVMLRLKESLKTTYCQTLTKQQRKITLEIKIMKTILYLLL